MKLVAEAVTPKLLPEQNLAIAKSLRMYHDLTAEVDELKTESLVNKVNLDEKRAAIQWFLSGENKEWFELFNLELDAVDEAARKVARMVLNELNKRVH